VTVFASVRTRDAEVARDLGQDVMMSVLTALREGQLRDPERVTAFVYGTARNVVNNYLRVGRQRRLEALPEELAAATVDPTDEMEAGRRRDLMRKALARLSKTDRGVLVLTLVDGLKPGEIASRLGLASDTVRTRKSRALKRVVERIAELSRIRS
jgi:RNA polymerase sigma factor (sigma-70 family)